MFPPLQTQLIIQILQISRRAVLVSATLRWRVYILSVVPFSFSTSIKNVNKNSKSISNSLFLPTRSFLPVNHIVPNTDDVCLTAVHPRKAIFVSQLTPNTSENNIKSCFAAKVPSVNLKAGAFSNWLNLTYQHRSITCSKVLNPTENMKSLFNTPLWPIGFLVKEFIPRNCPRNTNTVIISTPKN